MWKTSTPFSYLQTVRQTELSRRTDQLGHQHMKKSIHVACSATVRCFSSFLFLLFFLLFVAGVAGRSALMAGLPPPLVLAERIEASVIQKTQQKKSATCLKWKNKRQMYSNLRENVRKDCSAVTMLPRRDPGTLFAYNKCSTRSNNPRRTGTTLKASFTAVAQFDCAFSAEYRRPQARKHWIRQEA